ncbi:DUF116 domain-containing protein [uncultured Methanobrevibacter sp.]|uniref:DUF116 domain-containing protein n=1 Tax=uncultured Methanobrevibacter sp. TaxID=253161 RepID=UPI0026108307|nr:DUF116 domain-containing protein [uncultured Methanobrevibacter sp.]
MIESDSPYYVNDEYYVDVKHLTDDFLDFAHSYFDDNEIILEGLIVSVYWNLCCDKFSSLKEIIDYLEYVGDFNDQLPYLRKWESIDFSKYLILGDWFCENASKYLSTYTLELDNYLEKYEDKPKSNKEKIFFNSPKELYYLNMLSSEIMGRISRSDYESRKRKAIILPTCMKINQKTCRAVEKRLGEVCIQCNDKCEIAKINKEYDCEVYLVSHKSSAFQNASAEDKDELAIIGVACPLNLISGGWKALTVGMPPQCVLLEKVACARHWLNEDTPSSISKNRLKEVF